MSDRIVAEDEQIKNDINEKFMSLTDNIIESLQLYTVNNDTVFDEMKNSYMIQKRMVEIGENVMELSHLVTKFHIRKNLHNIEEIDIDKFMKKAENELDKKTKNDEKKEGEINIKQ